MATKRTNSRQRLGKELILKAGVAFADKHGVEKLSMRNLADTLGCGVMSLYNHVPNKEDLLVGMVDIAAGEIELPITGGDWKHALRISAASAHGVMLQHRWVPAEWSRRMPGPRRIRYMDAILQVLTEAGLKPRLVYSGYHAVTMHIVGFALQEIAYQQVLEANFEEVAKQFLHDISDKYPYMADHVRAHLVDDCQSDEFGFVLDLILNGLENANAKSLKKEPQ